MACGGVRAVACGACVHAVRFARSRRMACVRGACVRWCVPFVELILWLCSREPWSRDEGRCVNETEFF